MAAQEEISTGAANPTHITFDQPHRGGFQINRSASSGEDDIIYTPAESVGSMASSSSEGTTPSASASRTATHGSLPPPMAGAANISIREYIYFLPYPLPPGTPVPYSIGLPSKNPLNLPPHQFEPTSTLVLTSPNRTFVDIRLYKPFHSDSTTPLPNKSEKNRLEWAFAGTSDSFPLPNRKDWDGVSHSTWTHWLDSRHAVASPDIPVDEGDMYPIGPDLTLEHGHAFHPALNAVKSHEEMWRDVASASISSDAAGSKVCVVLRVHNDAAGVRGVVIRVGQVCQGIVMKGKEVTVERWEWEQGEGKGWRRTARVGDLWVPCMAACREEVLAVGGSVRYKDYVWAVEEVWEWV